MRNRSFVCRLYEDLRLAYRRAPTWTSNEDSVLAPSSHLRLQGVEFAIQHVFVVTIAAGLVVVAVVSLSPLYADDARMPQPSSTVGGLLVAGALLLGVAASLLDTAAERSCGFLASFVLLLLGALLLLGGDDQDEGPPHGDDDPPWWPAFETGFRSYVEAQRRPAPRRPVRR
jgi:hypothetical protein